MNTIQHIHLLIRHAWNQIFDQMDRMFLSRVPAVCSAVITAVTGACGEICNGNGDVRSNRTTTVERRIEQVHGRFAIVLPPPVDTVNFPMCSDKTMIVVASRLVSDKRIDLIVDAFKEMPSRRSVVLGDGPEMKRLKLHAGPNVMIKGRVSRKRSWLTSLAMPKPLFLPRTKISEL